MFLQRYPPLPYHPNAIFSHHLLTSYISTHEHHASCPRHLRTAFRACLIVAGFTTRMRHPVSAIRAYALTTRTQSSTAHSPSSSTHLLYHLLFESMPVHHTCVFIRSFVKQASLKCSYCISYRSTRTHIDLYTKLLKHVYCLRS